MKVLAAMLALSGAGLAQAPGATSPCGIPAKALAISPNQVGVIDVGPDGIARGKLKLSRKALQPKGGVAIEFVGVGRSDTFDTGVGSLPPAEQLARLRLDMIVCDPDGRQVYPRTDSDSMVTALGIGRQLLPPGARRAVELRPEADGDYAFVVQNARAFMQVEVLARVRDVARPVATPKVLQLDDLFGMERQSSRQVSVGDDELPAVYTFTVMRPTSAEVLLDNMDNDDVDPYLDLIARGPDERWRPVAKDDDTEGYNARLSEELVPGLEYAIAVSSVDSPGTMKLTLRFVELPAFQPSDLMLSQAAVLRFDRLEDRKALDRDTEAERFFAVPAGGSYKLSITSELPLQLELGMRNPLGGEWRNEAYVPLRKLGTISGTQSVPFALPSQSTLAPYLLRISLRPEAAKDKSLDRDIRLTLEIAPQ